MGTLGNPARLLGRNHNGGGAGGKRGGGDWLVQLLLARTLVPEHGWGAADEAASGSRGFEGTQVNPARRLQSGKHKRGDGGGW